MTDRDASTFYDDALSFINEMLDKIPYLSQVKYFGIPNCQTVKTVKLVKYFGIANCQTVKLVKYFGITNCQNVKTVKLVKYFGIANC